MYHLNRPKNSWSLYMYHGLSNEEFCRKSFRSMTNVRVSLGGGPQPQEQPAGGVD